MIIFFSCFIFSFYFLVRILQWTFLSRSRWYCWIIKCNRALYFHFNYLKCKSNSVINNEKSFVFSLSNTFYVNKTKIYLFWKDTVERGIFFIFDWTKSLSSHKEVLSLINSLVFSRRNCLNPHTCSKDYAYALDTSILPLV